MVYFALRYIIITPGSSEIDVVLLARDAAAAVTVAACSIGSDDGGGSILVMSRNAVSACELLGNT